MGDPVSLGARAPLSPTASPHCRSAITVKLFISFLLQTTFVVFLELHNCPPLTAPPGYLALYTFHMLNLPGKLIDSLVTLPLLLDTTWPLVPRIPCSLSTQRLAHSRYMINVNARSGWEGKGLAGQNSWQYVSTVQLQGVPNPWTRQAAGGPCQTLVPTETEAQDNLKSKGLNSQQEQSYAPLHTDRVSQLEPVSVVTRAALGMPGTV